MSNKRLLIAIALLISILLPGCMKAEEAKAPAIEVDFTHVIVDGKHVIKINKISKVDVNVSAVKLTYRPSFPGIHAFAIYSKGVSPVAELPVNSQGDLKLYVGFEKSKLPSEGENVTVVVAVRDGKGRDLALAMGVVKWE